MTDTEALASVGQKLQSAEEVYVYKIPPLKTAGGHRAEDWNLATPLKTCSLLVEQHGDQLHLLFQHTPTLELFACAKIDLTRQDKGAKLSLEYFVETVVDSSRYFVVRIVSDTGREARIGFGFRDRDEAIDFRESLQYYVKSIQRQEEAAHFEVHHPELHLSSLEGEEKIHINMGGKKTSTPKSPKKTASGGSALLLKKPPPAPKLNPDIAISFGDIDLNADHLAGTDGASSTAAMGEASSAGDDEEEIWQDFEDAT